MNEIANNIRQRHSLRAPQRESLELLAYLTDQLSLKKNANLEEEAEKIRQAAEKFESVKKFSEFERTFPNLCFSLATGVGKTRLMGSFITYLYLAKGIKNFFVLAPNLTIYNKLKEDFGNPAHPKYVFVGISDFVYNPPMVITGDNFDRFQNLDTQQSFLKRVKINIFNISKINSEARSGKDIKVKRFREYIGDSYFNYLSNLNDLVLLMDESHHYRADRGLAVINELNPVLGLEVTATPQIEKGNQTIKFKNVVYEYSLAKAIQDGFVKEPAVATRKNFDPKNYSPEELDLIKLEDGIRIHEDTKTDLDIYSRDNKCESVKPFVLVVAKDTKHAEWLESQIKSPSFFKGNYADKVLQIHSNQKGSEKEENIERLLTLENPVNKIEIVIHVNMLKEGWDVTNLYTIIPLRTATSMTLREQTIGRGLRLPYGQKTGCSKVDKLTIIAHDKFQEIIEEANKPTSIIKRENVIEIDAEELKHTREVRISYTNQETIFKDEEIRIQTIEDKEERQKATLNLEARKAVHSVLPSFGKKGRNVNELNLQEVKTAALVNKRDELMSKMQLGLFTEQVLEDIKEEIDKVCETVINEFVAQIIEIPRIIIIPSEDVTAGFHDFELETKNLNYPPVSEEIIRQSLSTNERETILGQGKFIRDKLDNILVNEMINIPEVDYDRDADLLFKLARQAIEKFKSLYDEESVINIIQYRKRDISAYIESQLRENYYYESIGYENPIVYPFVEIVEHNYSRFTEDKIYNFRDTIEPISSIPSKVFEGFKKACHREYKFDSKTEKDLAILLEDDNNILKWLRPAQNQFYIYWDHRSKRYEPDFVVETNYGIFMVETKKEKDIETVDVAEKTKAALQYCRHATDYTTQNNGKPWKYILIPHNAVRLNMSFDNLAKEFEVKDEN